MISLHNNIHRGICGVTVFVRGNEPNELTGNPGQEYVSFHTNDSGKNTNPSRLPLMIGK